MFRALNELKSDVAVVDKLLKTPSTIHYSKSTHRIKNAHMQNINNFTIIIYISPTVACWYSHLHARVKNLIKQPQLLPTKWRQITKL